MTNELKVELIKNIEQSKKCVFERLENTYALIIKAVETGDKSLLEFVKGNGYSEGSIIDGMIDYLKTVFDTENDSKKCYIKYGINDISEDNVAYLIDVASGKILASEEGDSLFRMTETLKSKAISAGYEIIDKEQKL